MTVMKNASGPSTSRPPAGGAPNRPSLGRLDGAAVRRLAVLHFQYDHGFLRRTMRIEREFARDAGEAHTVDRIADVGAAGLRTRLFDGLLEHVDGIVSQCGEGVRRGVVLAFLYDSMNFRTLVLDLSSGE